MPIKSLLAVVDTVPSGRGALLTGLALARQFSCALDVFQVREDPAAAMPLIGENMSGALIDEMISVAEQRSDARMREVRKLFDETCSELCINAEGGKEPSARFFAIEGFEDEVIADRSCRADLLIIGRPASSAQPAAYASLKAALVEGGRAVLACPPELPAGLADAGDAPLFKAIAIFWNGSAAAARAVQEALPFLVCAENVHVFIAEEAGAMANSDDLETHLTRHGIAPKICAIKPPEGRSASVLLDKATEKGADLLVMGAYTRSRVRQLIFGSVTAHVLDAAKLPVLMMH